MWSRLWTRSRARGPTPTRGLNQQIIPSTVFKSSNRHKLTNNHQSTHRSHRPVLCSAAKFLTASDGEFSVSGTDGKIDTWKSGKILIKRGYSFILTQGCVTRGPSSSKLIQTSNFHFPGRHLTARLTPQPAHAIHHTGAGASHDAESKYLNYCRVKMIIFHLG